MPLDPAEADSAPTGVTRPDRLTGWSAMAPFAIVAYVLLLAALRLSLSPFLEIDEAEFVGQVDVRLLYGNSHPPLFNWLTRLALELTDWDWALSISVVRFGLLAAYHWLIWDSARRLSNPRAALLAVAAAAFLPQIVWMSVFTLAHSIMAMTGVAAVVNVTLRLIEAPSARRWFWLGMAGALAALGKFNAFLFLGPFLAALWLSPVLRARLAERRAWIGVGAFVAAVGPVLVALLADLGGQTARLGKLFGDGPFQEFDLPGVGVDGFLALLLAMAAWAGPAAALWMLARGLDRPRPRFQDDATELGGAMVAALGRGMAWAVAILALLLLAADAHKVHERYLTPLLAALPIYLAVRWPLARSGAWVAALAALVYLSVPVGFWAAATHGKHRYGYPYAAVASQMARQTNAPLPILSTRHDDVANVILALGWPGASSPRYQPVGKRAMLLWQGRSEAPEGLAPADFGPGGPIITVKAPFINRREGVMIYRFQLFERLIPGAGPRPHP